MTDTKTPDAKTPTFTFAEAEVPKRAGGPGRQAEPNPFLETVANLDKRRQENDKLTLVLTVPKDEATKRKGQLSKAGEPINRTVRIVSEIDGDNVKLTFWTVAKIVHPEKTPAELKAIADKRKATLAAKKAEAEKAAARPDRKG